MGSILDDPEALQIASDFLDVWQGSILTYYKNPKYNDIKKYLSENYLSSQFYFSHYNMLDRVCYQVTVLLERQGKIKLP